MRRMPPVSRLAPRTDGGKTERESGHASNTHTVIESNGIRSAKWQINLPTCTST